MKTTCPKCRARYDLPDSLVVALAARKQARGIGWDLANSI